MVIKKCPLCGGDALLALCMQENIYFVRCLNLSCNLSNYNRNFTYSNEALEDWNNNITVQKNPDSNPAGAIPLYHCQNTK